MSDKVYIDPKDEILDPAFTLYFLYSRYPVFIIDAFYTLEQDLLLCILLTVEEQENSEN